MPRLTCVLVCWLLLWHHATRARGDDHPGVRLAWIRGPGADDCPALRDLQAEIARRLGRDPFRAPAAQTLEARVERDAQGVYRASLAERDLTGQLLGSRTLTSEAPRCDALASAVVLALSLAIDADATTPSVREVPVRPIPGARVEYADSERPVVQSQRPRQVGRAPLSGRRLELGAVVTWQLLPGLAAGGTLTLDGALKGPLRWVVGVSALPTRRRDDMAFWAATGHAGLCLSHGSARLVLTGCGAATLGAIHAESSARTAVHPGFHAFGAFDMSADLAVVVHGPLFVRGGLGVSVPFVRYRFTSEGANPSEFRQAVAIPSLRLTAGWHFP